jgi:hypothetical protein
MKQVLCFVILSPERSEGTEGSLWLNEKRFFASLRMTVKNQIHNYLIPYRVSYAIITTTTPLPPFGTTPCPHNPLPPYSPSPLIKGDKGGCPKGARGLSPLIKGGRGVVRGIKGDGVGGCYISADGN